MTDNAVVQLAELTRVGNYGLVWTPTGSSRSEYELRNGQQYLVARFWKAGLKATSASGMTDRCKVKMRREGFLGRRIAIEVQSGPFASARFYYKGFWGQGRLRLSTGRELKWMRGTITGDRWAFVGMNGGMLVEFVQLNANHWTDATSVNVSEIGISLPETSLLILLGWYLILLMVPNEHAIADDSQPFYSERFDS